MAFSYKPLWKLLIDRDITKKQLMQETGISKPTISKMTHCGQVSLDVIDRICSVLHCNVEDVLTHVDSSPGESQLP